MNALKVLAATASLSILAVACGGVSDEAVTTDAPVEDALEEAPATDAPVEEAPATDAPVEEVPTTTDAPVEEPVAETTATTEPVPEGPAPVCSYTGTDPDFGYMQVDLSFTNTLGDVVDPEVTYALAGSDGVRFFTGTAGGLDLVDIMFATANEQFRLAVDTREKIPPAVDAAAISCSVLALEDDTLIDGFVSASEDDTCEVLGTDSSGRIEVDITATSPYENTTTVQTWWALSAPGPIRFVTDTNVDDLIGAGETFKVVPSFNAEKPEWIGDDEITCAVVGFWDQDVYSS